MTEAYSVVNRRPLIGFKARYDLFCAIFSELYEQEITLSEADIELIGQDYILDLCRDTAEHIAWPRDTTMDMPFNGQREYTRLTGLPCRKPHTWADQMEVRAMMLERGDPKGLVPKFDQDLIDHPPCPCPITDFTPMGLKMMGQVMAKQQTA